MHFKRRVFLCPTSSRRSFLVALPALLLTHRSAAASQREFVGAYSDEQMVKVKRLTFPRVHLYDRSGKLVDRQHWPRELVDVKKRAGEAFCCISDKPPPPGSSEPPPDCKIIVYGEDVQEHFTGLLSSSGRLVSYRDLPAHKFLVVEYFADWCAPCAPGRRALESFIASPSGAEYVVVIVDFSRLPKAQEFVQQRDEAGK